MDIIDGDNFLCEDEELELVLSEIALNNEDGEGIYIGKLGTQTVEFSYNLGT